MWFHKTDLNQQELHLGLLLALLGLLGQLLGSGLHLGRQVCAETLSQYLQWSQVQCIAKVYITLQCSIVHYTASQYNSMQCCVLQEKTIKCNKVKLSTSCWPAWYPSSCNTALRIIGLVLLLPQLAPHVTLCYCPTPSPSPLHPLSTPTPSILNPSLQITSCIPLLLHSIVTK